MGLSGFHERAQRDFQSFKHAFTSRKAFVKFIETKPTAGNNTEAIRNQWTNEDLDISPTNHHTWGWYDYAAFWFSYGFSPGLWYLGAALLANGLTPAQALGCLFLGFFFGAVGIVMHSRAAAVYHFGFPVESRLVWGLWGSYFPIIIRALCALIWGGVTIATGGYFTSVLLRCIFGDSYWNLPNHIPQSSHITVQQLIGIIVYWFMTCWTLSIPIPKLRRAYEIQMLLTPPTIIGLFIFCVVTGRGHAHKALYEVEPKHGAALSWALLTAVNSGLAKTTTLMVNQPDIARYARNKVAPIWSQLIMFPAASTACAALGIYATQAIFNAWGNIDWNPWDLNHDMLDHNFSHGRRAGIAIINLVFIYGNTLIELGANVIPFGADFMALFPRWLNIRRGMWMCYILGVCICPWQILATATGFLKFLNGYSIFLGSFLGMALTDYIVVRKGNVFVKDLYQAGGRYWYFHGVSWRAVVTWIISVSFMLPGFARTFGAEIANGDGWSHLYAFSWFYTCTVSSVVYFALSFVGDFAKEEKAMSFEHLAGSEVLLEAQAVEAQSDFSEVALSVEQKV
ncbi:uncharacterized protein A1O9_11997 [Exophiala aquamarina CBS 119918]|uniref:NCS1 family nucleobase:cation symporter-1 n=1 Tax=Exophiala aquamarina CBS 119918 TaxID=1182545 RepID=A0A072NX53_9EURO|nr:uncharacterized protein A1O9_11997 [Exophiala aquamarina CBS 119918]KEF52007.1 hypothetical protein A1O9_11997 [Exophiala aquamarina CBS 119918]